MIRRGGGWHLTSSTPRIADHADEGVTGMPLPAKHALICRPRRTETSFPLYRHGRDGCVRRFEASICKTGMLTKPELPVFRLTA